MRSPYAAGITRVGTLKRITSSTTYPAPGSGFRNVGYNFVVTLANLAAGSNPILEVESAVGSARLSLVNRINATVYPTRQKFYFDSPIFGDNNADYRVRVTGAPGAWEIEFFLSIQPNPV